MDTPQEVLVFLCLLRRWNKKKFQQTQRQDCSKNHELVRVLKRKVSLHEQWSVFAEQEPQPGSQDVSRGEY